VVGVQRIFERQKVGEDLNRKWVQTSLNTTTSRGGRNQRIGNSTLPFGQGEMVGGLEEASYLFGARRKHCREGEKGFQLQTPGVSRTKKKKAQKGEPNAIPTAMRRKNPKNWIKRSRPPRKSSQRKGNSGKRERGCDW